MTTIEGSYLPASAGQLHARISGEGEPLVLLHPTPRSSRVFASLMGELADFRCIALDMRGFGESAPPSGPRTMYDYARDVVDALDALGVPRAHVLGLHTGNKVGAALAATYPERIASFVLVGMTHSIVLDQEARNGAMRGVLAKRPGDPSAPATRAALLKRWGETYQALTSVWWRPAVVADDALEAPDLDRLREEALDRVQADAGYDLAYAANFAFDLRAALAGSRVPTLVIELAVPREEHLGRQAPAIAALMADCETHTIPADDRDLLRYRPALLAAPTRDFCRRRALR